MDFKTLRHLCVGMIVIGCLVACGVPTLTPTAPNASFTAPTPIKVTLPPPIPTNPPLSLPTATLVVQPTLVINPTTTSIPGATTTPTQSELKILAPEDNATVNIPEVVVQGEATPGTVITLNDVILLVDQTGTFSATVPLEEGPNVIEGVASDPQGNETDFELIVTYDPES